MTLRLSGVDFASGVLLASGVLFANGVDFARGVCFTRVLTLLSFLLFFTGVFDIFVFLSFLISFYCPSWATRLYVHARGQSLRNEHVLK